MVDRITSSLAREAILAALEDQKAAARSVRDEAAKLFEASIDRSALEARPNESRAAEDTDAVAKLKEGFLAVDREVRAASPDQLAKDMLAGRVTDFAEIATRVNRARISFEFAMEIRNKLIEAYRETMRMTV